MLRERVLQVGQPGGGFSCAGNAFAVADAAQMSPPRRSGATLKNVSASKNVVVEQNACYRAPKWFSDRASPASGVARAERPLHGVAGVRAFDEDDTSVDDVIADVPETLGHVLLDDAAFDVGVDSWAHGSVVAQILADSVLSAYKEARGPRAWAPKSPSSEPRTSPATSPRAWAVVPRGDVQSRLSDAGDQGAPDGRRDGVRFDPVRVRRRGSIQFQQHHASGFGLSSRTESGRRSILRRRTRWSSRDRVGDVGRGDHAGCLFRVRDVGRDASPASALVAIDPRVDHHPDGVNAHAFDPDAAAHIKLVVRNGSVPALRVYASRAECEHDEEGGRRRGGGPVRRGRRRARTARWTSCRWTSFPGRSRDNRVVTRSGPTRSSVLATPRRTRGRPRCSRFTTRRGTRRRTRSTGSTPGARPKRRRAESPQAALVAFRRRAGGVGNAPRAVRNATHGLDLLFDVLRRWPLRLRLRRAPIAHKNCGNWTASSPPICVAAAYRVLAADCVAAAYRVLASRTVRRRLSRALRVLRAVRHRADQARG